MHPVLGLGSLATGRAPHEVGRGLDLDEEFGGHLGHVEHPEAVESQQRFRQPDTVAHGQGSPVVAAFDSRNDGGAPDRFGGPSDYLTPHSDAKSRE